MTTPTPPTTPPTQEPEKLDYILTSKSEIASALAILGRRKPRGPFKPGDVMRIRAFLRWALQTGCFSAGTTIDIFSITDRAEAEGWPTDEESGEDAVRVAGVLEGLHWENFKTLRQAVVIWPAPPGAAATGPTVPSLQEAGK